VRLLQSLDKGLLGATLLDQRASQSQGVAHLAEGGLDRLLVLRHRDLAVDLGGP